MQIQKDEIREKIIAVAEVEFLNKGFKGASMRVIAQKAHTTLGNLYNYFENKEAILDAVLGHIPKIIEEMMEKHKEMAYIEKLPEKEILYQMEALAPVFFEFDVLLSKPFIILMEGCKGTKYENYSKRLFELASSHMEEHLGSGNQVMAEIIAQSFITTLLGIGKRKECLEEKKKALLKYTEIIILGILASKMND